MVPWVSWLVSFVGGGLMGALATIGYNWWNAKQTADAKEKGVIASLAGEVRHSRVLCEHNARLRQKQTGPFIRFPPNCSSERNVRGAI